MLKRKGCGDQRNSSSEHKEWKKVAQGANGLKKTTKSIDCKLIKWIKQKLSFSFG